MRSLVMAAVVGVPCLAHAAPTIEIGPSGTIGFGGSGQNGGGPLGVRQFGFFEVRNTGDTQLVVAEMTITGPVAIVFGDGPCTTQTCNGPFAIDPGASRGFLLGCTPTTAGYLTGSLAITSNATGGTSTAALSCIGNHPPVIQVSPGALDFGTSHSCNVGDTCGPTCAAQPLTQTLTITNGAPDPSDLTFYIAPPLPASTVFDEWAIVDDCRQALPCSLGPNQARAIQYTFRPHGGQPQLYTTPLAITSNYPGVVPVSVPFYAEGGWGQLGFDTPSNLGSIAPGQTLTKSFTVRNTGRSCLTFQPPISSNPAIAVVGPNPASIRLAAGATHTFTLTCTPPTLNGASATLSFDLSFENSDLATRNVFCGGLAASVSPTSFAFGTIAYPSWSSHDFSLVNAGSGELVVEGVATAGDFAVENLPVPAFIPGSSTHTFAVVPTPRSLGELADTITIALQGLADLEIDVAALATDPALVVTPADYRLAHGTVDVDVGPKSSMVTLQNTTATPITIATCTIAGDPELTIITPCPFTIGASSTSSLAVRFAPTAEASSTATVTLTGTGFATGTLRVRTSGTGIDQHVALSALDTSFGDVVRRPLEAPTRTVTIQNTDATVELAITSLGIDNPSFAVMDAAPFTLAPGASRTLTLTFVPTAYGEAIGHLTFGNADDSMIARVALSGRGIARPIEVGPRSIDLGEVPVGTATRIGGAGIELHNLSTTNTFELTRVALDGEGFALVGPDRTTLAPDATASLDVELVPPAAGTYTATIQIFLDGDPDAHAEVVVTAHALATASGGCCSSSGGAGSAGLAAVVMAVIGRRRPKRRGS